MIGDELTIRGYEFSSGLIHQSMKEDVSLLSSSPKSPFYGRFLTLYSYLWIILVLHLLVIHAHT